MAPDKMIRMGNQIAEFFRTQPGIDPAAKTLEHIIDFWEPRMRQQLCDYVAEGGSGLDAEVIKAAQMMA
ncbi:MULTISPECIES: formate dehydrogenase subunit delta [Pacificibacter]|jgi:formate dehydrogenase subunit delta|uniref:formate dehydrogenase subunit delta n=1 Tax=Pacificibacter TaxID=1042323 RepID=UPI001C08ED7A|nr:MULTISPECIES: formate dehydrogenase subunit delta [Pacificibacter]MBU2937755.1 formate dehydrogenase subunit delta [Pacificibacter marinus]MDO6616016.1 formate dehydrogenase subunit delta [Pacificibacter sp. 1_MG-2023]